MAIRAKTAMRFIWTFVASAALAACSGGLLHGISSTGSGALPAVSQDASTKKIQHIVIMIQENRSFDDFFATFPGADGTRTGLTHTGAPVQLKQVSLSDIDLPHDHGDFLHEYNYGKMNNWDTIQLGGTGQLGPAGTFAYQYVNPAQIAPYWSLAKQYVLADHMFPTQSSGSFTAHQDLIAAGTEFAPGKSVSDFPDSSNLWWGCDSTPGTKTSLLTAIHWVIGTADNWEPGKGPFPCFDYPTIRDLLDARHISWKYYIPSVPNTSARLFDAFDAIRAVRYGPEWETGTDPKVITPEKTVFTDISNGTLASVSWVIPDYVNSDHPYDPPAPKTDTGPSWVASVVNAIGQSQYWKSTAIIILWDDWGGYYDHVKPPQLDYQGLGFRVPCIIVSPYVRKGYISHTQYEFGSILKYIEGNWGLPRLGTEDKRANTLGNVFDFKQAPRRFIKIKAKYSEEFFLHQPESGIPVDSE